MTSNSGMSNSFAAGRGEVNSGGSPWPGAFKNAVCPTCFEEMHQLTDRRFRYPFHCCNDCGPGYTITLRLPWDRPNTTMAPFEMCEACRAEFEDPGGRHFRSPTVCCPDCGPSYWIEPAPPVGSGGDVIHETAQLLSEGSILALKDTCSFRLLVRARDDELVLRLRRRKGLHDAPLGVMIRDLEMARGLAELDARAEALLTSPSAPLVLVPRRESSDLSEHVAPHCAEIGLMLPRSPFHHLLMEEMGEPLVMAGANPGGEVMVLENEDARESLMDIADHLVLHDLQLHSSCEDSVVRVDADGPLVLRRSSGYAPRPLALPRSVPPILALGAFHEATLAIAQDRAIHVSQHLGNLDTARAVDNFQRTLDRLLELWECEPAFIAYDEHPLSYGRQVLERFDAIPIPVDHHHAHVASVLVEHGCEEPVLGISLDAVAHRLDVTIGSGEFLRTDAARVETLERMPAFRVPGAEFAPRDPWRTAMGLLHDHVDPELALEWAQRHAPDPDAARSAHHMLRNGAGCRRITSFGQLYDGAAALLGICVRASYEGQATRRLGALAGRPRPEPLGALPDAREVAAGDYLSALLRELLARGLRHPGDPEDAAWAQEALAQWVASRAVDLARREGLDTIAAGGGCLANSWLRAVLRREGDAAGIRVLTNHEVPPGDGGLSLGQAWVAAARAEVAMPG